MLPRIALTAYIVKLIERRYTSFAAGCDAHAATDGSFVWSGYNGGCTPVTAATVGEFLALAPGGVQFYTNTSLTAGLGIDTSGNVTAASFSGSGAGLTSLNPANIASGTAVISITGNAATATNSTELNGVAASGYATTGANTFTGNQTVTGNVGIGTTTPAATLDVEGPAAGNGTNGLDGLHVTAQSGGNSAALFGTGGSGGNILIQGGAGGAETALGGSGGPGGNIILNPGAGGGWPPLPRRPWQCDRQRQPQRDGHDHSGDEGLQN